VNRRRVIPLLVINRLNKAATNELGARAIIMVDARMAQARPKARGNYKTNVKAKAFLVATADTTRRTDGVVVRVVKVNGKMVMKVSEVVVPKARRLNSLLSPFIPKITGRPVFDIVHIHFFSISCNRLEAKSS
jgi:hypothetical protein